MCKKHGKPILPGNIKCGYKTWGCSVCVKEKFARYNTNEIKNKRAKEWDNDFIACIHCKIKRCKRSNYRYSGKKYCSSCSIKNKRTGEFYECHLRGNKKQRESGYSYLYLRSWRLKRKLMGAY
ncbi:hypothetical protein LCGC14_1736530 [marine sediment metagenome]|uniref:Uncharacterized protein n=1 Tax=marine sediment metagenome TaxID=412755 RepID=A0A0F9H7Y9_9ZZZZ